MKNRLLILLLAAATFLALLGRKDIVTSHEARVAQTARIMAASGWPGSVQPVSVPVMRMVEIDGIKQLLPEQGKGEMQVNPWLVPVINHQLRLQKPPLPYWCAAIVFRLAGFGEWQARLVPALLGALATLLMWDLASLLLGRRAGWIAAGVWLSTHFIVDEFRKSMADPYLAFCTLMCVWAWVRHSSLSPVLRGEGRGEGREALAGKLRDSQSNASNPSPLPSPRSTGERESGKFVLLLLFYLSLALGALAKGPVIFITILLALIALHLCQGRRVGPWWAHLIGIAIFAAIVIPWPVYIIRHVPNAMDIWRYESVGEMTGENTEKARPWWMYIGNSFQLPLPWTPLWMGGFAVAFVHGWRGVKGRRGRRRMVAILWQVLTVVFFSLSSVKKPAYLLPAMAAQTLVTTDALMILLAFGRRGARGGSPRFSSLLSLAQALIGVGFAAGLTVVMIRSPMNRSVAIVAGAIAIIVVLLALAPIARKRLGSWLIMQFIAYAAILIVLLGLQQPEAQNHRSSRQFATAMAQYLHEAKLPLLVRVLPEDLAIYLPLDLPDAGDSPYALLAIDHSPKDPPETLESLSQIVRDAQVIEARRVPINAPDGNGRWRLFEVTLKRAGHQDLAQSDARDTRAGKGYIDQRLQGWESKNGARAINWLDIPRFPQPLKSNSALLRGHGMTMHNDQDTGSPVQNDPRLVAEALRLSEQRLRLALDAAQMGLWDIDLATHVRSESDTMGPLFGRPVGQVNPDVATWRQHIHPADLDRTQKAFRAAIEGEKEYRMQYRTLGADGVTRWIESRGRVVRDGQGNPTRVVGVAFDITEAKRAVAEREQLLIAEKEARKQAEMASKSKDQFLAVLSHELRTPLTPVLTLAQMLEADKSLSENVRETAATIRRNVELEARLIDDLLDLTRISRGKMLLHLTDVDVHEKLEQVEQICQADLRSEQLRLQMQLNATHYFVRADSARLQQVLWNLLKNAIKFTPHGGSICIATEDADEGALLVRVTDTGVGIRAEQLRTIFKPFEQGDASTTRLFGGLGLGLTISKALAEAHGGELTAQSEGESKGATFTLRLPTLIAPALPPAAPANHPRVTYIDPRRPRILLVEDHADTGKALKKLLGNFGYDVRIATTVASALQIAQAERLDLLISDLGLPDGTGHDLMRQLLAKFSIRGIALSGYGMEEDIRRSHQAGFIEHLTKPIDLDRLRSTIDRVMQGSEDVVIGH